MGLNILKGRDGLGTLREASKPRSGESKFLKLDDGESVTIRFLQELDEGGSQYAESRGIAYGYYEHINPDDFAQSFACTMDTEAKCAGCDLVTSNRKWRSRGRLVSNVLVRAARGASSDEADKVKIFSTSISSKGLTPQLVEFAEDYKSICDRDYKMTRRGTGIDTTYTLLPREVSPLTTADESADLIDLSTVMRNLAYAEQMDLLNGKSDW